MAALISTTSGRKKLAPLIDHNGTTINRDKGNKTVLGHRHNTINLNGDVEMDDRSDSSALLRYFKHRKKMSIGGQKQDNDYGFATPKLGSPREKHDEKARIHLRADRLSTSPVGVERIQKVSPKYVFI